MWQELKRRFWRWAPLYSPISPPPRPDEIAAFERSCEEFTHGVSLVAVLLIEAVALLFWPLDRWVLPEAVAPTYHDLRIGLALFGLVCFVLLRLVPPGRAATALVQLGVVVFSALLGWFLGSLEGLLGLQYMYPMPIAIVLLAAPLRQRVVTAFASTASGWTAVILSAGGLPEVARGTLSSSAGATLIGLLFSEALMALMRGRFINGHRLAALRAHLEERIQEQGRDLHVLAQAQIDSRDAEVRWLSRELHDALGQEITAMRVVVDLAALQLEAGDGLASRDTLRELEGLLRRQQTSLRRILTRMRPEAVEQLGLLEAVRALVTEVTRGSPVRVDLALDEDFEARAGAIPPTVADTLYRILQEALSNVVRHAGATVASVTLERDGDSVVLRVADDGKGPSVALSGGCHVGLLGIRERAALCDGHATWGPGPQRRGMQVDVKLPLPGVGEPHRKDSIEQSRPS